jgi:integrase
MFKERRAAREDEAKRRGWEALPEWVFPSERGGPLQVANVRGRAFKRVLEHAKLPSHITPHCLRHTFASQLLQAGVSPVFVQRALGHSTIALTVDLYGRWLPMRDLAAVDRLDAEWSRNVGDGRYI